jgi:hypothetical protein
VTRPWPVVYCSVYRYGPFAVAKIGCSTNFPSRVKYVRKTATQMFGPDAEVRHYVIVSGSYDLELQIDEDLQGFAVFPLGPPRVTHPRHRAGWCEWVFWTAEVERYIMSFAPLQLSPRENWKLKLNAAIRASKAAALARTKKKKAAKG